MRKKLLGVLCVFTICCAGCTVTERTFFKEVKSKPEGVYYCKEELVQTEDGQVFLQRTSEFDPNKAIHVATELVEAGLDGLGRIAGSAIRLIPGMAAIFPEPPPWTPPGGS